MATAGPCVQGETSLPRPANMVLFSFSCWLALDLPTWTDVQVQLQGRDGLVQCPGAADAGDFLKLHRSWRVA